MTESRQWFSLVVFALFLTLLYLLSPILSPFLVAALLAYLGDPLVDYFETKKIPRTAGVSLVFLIFTLVIVLLLLIVIPLLGKQLDIMVSKIPVILTWLEKDFIPMVMEKLGHEHESAFSVLQSTLSQNWQSATGIASQIIKQLSSSSLRFAAWIANLVLIPVVAFYLLRDWDILVAKLANLLPRSVLTTASGLVKECDDVIGQFLRGQLLVMLALGLIYSIGLAIVGLEVALVVGMTAGLASVVPYLGFIIGIAMATVAALVQHQGEIMALIPVFIVFGIGQVLEGWVLTPLLVGDKIGLHPVAVIFAILAGGQLFGFTGVLLALPVSAVIVVFVRHAHDKYLLSNFYTTPSESN